MIVSSLISMGVWAHGDWSRSWTEINFSRLDEDF